MIPPHVDACLPREGGTFEGSEIVLHGSLLGLLFSESPPEVWDTVEQCVVPTVWTETATGGWHAEAPAVGGDVQTQVRITLARVVPGRAYRFRYPVDLHEVQEVLLTALVAQGN